MRKAFTLIELLIVIAIIGILAGILFVSIGTNPLRDSRDVKRAGDLQNLRTALTLYYNDNASYPATIGDAAFVGPYIPAPPKDPKHDDPGCGLAAYTSNDAQAFPTATNLAGDYGYRYNIYPTGCTTASKNCTAYVLQACLENSTAKVLNSDCDTGANPSCLADPVFDIHS